MSNTPDVVIVGAGSAGLAALREVRKRTENFLVINDGPWGTICARVGCMPSKLLIEAANAFHRRGTFEEFGIRGAERLSVDVPAVLRRVRRLRDGFVAGTLKATDTLDERAISGRVRLLGPGQLEVDGRKISARSIILATGSRPVVPEAWQQLGGRLLTTDTLFEQENLPARIAVVGMGAIGVEMAQALARLGLEISAFGHAAGVAGLSDPKVNAVATDLLGGEFALQLGVRAELTPAQDGVRVRAGDSDLTVDAVLAALGRRPNIDDLGLETLGIALDQRGMPPVDSTTQQVGEFPVFLAGDANGQTPLLHEAADEGHIAGINACRMALSAGTPACFARRTRLAIVFAEPGIAVVGQRFRELDAASTLAGEVRFENQGRARAGQRNHGILRLYAEPQRGRLLGAEMCAPAAEHMAHLLALAIDRELTVRDLLRLPFYHPVLEEGLRSALRELAAQLPRGGESDLDSCGAFEAIGAEALD